MHSRLSGDLRKFQNVDTHIGSAMKSVGEVMAIGDQIVPALEIHCCSFNVANRSYVRRIIPEGLVAASVGDLEPR